MPRTKKDIDKITEDIVREVRNTLQDDVYKIILFGSYARGDYDEGSDMDIMVISDTDFAEVKNLRNSIHKVASRISLNNDIEVSMLIRDRKNFEGRDDYPFYRSIKEEGIQIYG